LKECYVALLKNCHARTALCVRFHKWVPKCTSCSRRLQYWLIPAVMGMSNFMLSKFFSYSSIWSMDKIPNQIQFTGRLRWTGIVLSV